MDTNTSLDFNAKKGFICDMDGVIYHGNRILPGGRLHLRWSGVTVRPFRSIVRNRSFCLRASAFPFGAA